MEALSRGVMIVSDKEKLFTLGKSFNFHQNVLKVKSPMVKSSSSEAVVPLNSAIGKYFEEAIGDDKIITKIIKACNQATISPAIIELKTALGKQYMTKDVKNGWAIDYIVLRDKNLVVMKSRKTEQHIQEVFQYTWQLQIVFDSNTAEIHSIDLNILEISFAPPHQLDDSTSQHKQAVMSVLLKYAPNG